MTAAPAAKPNDMKLDFWKYEGAGNDFVLVDGRTHDGLELPGETVSALCNRHTGIGADGLMILRSEKGYDFRMQYFNADGGEVNMCGNGGRCITLFARHLGIVSGEASFVGRDGEHHARILADNGESAVIELGMVDVDSYEYSDNAFFLNTGVPHYVEFVDDLAAVDIVARGREIRWSERFAASGGTNADFVQIKGEGRIDVRTYERGVEDETLACGTGAVAATIATHLLAQNTVTSFSVVVPGGRLDVSFRADGDERFTGVKLTGPASRVFSGTIDTANLRAK